jgi:hypothetical protein
MDDFFRVFGTDSIAMGMFGMDLGSSRAPGVHAAAVSTDHTPSDPRIDALAASFAQLTALTSSSMAQMATISATLLARIPEPSSHHPKAGGGGGRGGGGHGGGGHPPSPDRAARGKGKGGRQPAPTTFSAFSTAGVGATILDADSDFVPSNFAVVVDVVPLVDSCFIPADPRAYPPWLPRHPTDPSALAVHIHDAGTENILSLASILTCGWDVC